MLKFIWNSWWRNKERFILLLVGVLIVSTGLSYLVGLTESNKGTVVSELEKRWKSSYHIVVRPPGTRSVTEELDLLEPNYMSGLQGGITLEQYEQIKQIDDIEVAAPIAMIGSYDYYTEVGEFELNETAVYRVNFKEETNTGARVETDSSTTYFLGNWRPTDADPNYGMSPVPTGTTFRPSFGSNFMIAGVDPQAESELVGLDRAIVGDADISRYLPEGEVEISPEGAVQVPAIISTDMFVDAKMSFELEKIDLPFEGESAQEIAEKIRDSGGEAYLQTLSGEKVDRIDSVSTGALHQGLIDRFMAGEGFRLSNDFSSYNFLAMRPSSLDYETVTSPFADRWPFAYQVKPYEVPEDSLYPHKQLYRPLNMFGETSADWPKVKLDYIGVFDPGKLDMARDPLTDLPMETYFPAKADWVIDADDEPVNPVKQMLPLNNDRGFLTRPPLVLTTLEAAAAILGDEPISAIRINVSGVDELNEASEARLQAVAKEIEEATGLITDVTLGSSPQMALTYLPGLKEGEALGWVQQPWVRLGSSFTIFEETKMGMGGVIASVILVAILYVFTSNVIMLYARKKEFAVLLSLGWGPRQLSRLLLIEALLLGSVVALIAWSILGAFLLAGDTATTGLRVVLIGFWGLGIYVLGSLVPMLMVRQIKPYEALRSGATTRGLRLVKSEGVLGMAFNQLVTQWKRTLLTLLAIAVPTSLFMFFLFVSVRLQGVMFTSLLGEYVALEVGTMHYVAMGVSLLIAILTTTEVMWQNINERRSEIAILKATGWRSANVRRLVLVEGGLLGFLAGLLGLVVAGVLVWNVYGSLPLTEVLFLTATLLVPVLTGVIGALLPAQMAVNVLPYQAMRGTQVNTKRTERRFKWVLGTVAGGLGAAVLTLFFFALPEGQQETVQREVVDVQGTKGEKLGDLDSDSTDPEPSQASSKTGAVAARGSKAFRYYEYDAPTYRDELVNIEKIVPTPDEVAPAKPGYKLVSIAVRGKTLQDDVDGNGGIVKYYPPGYKLLDDKGEEYKVKSFAVVERGGWEHNSWLRVPSTSLVTLTYEVPEESTRAALIVVGEIVTGEYVIAFDIN